MSPAAPRTRVHTPAPVAALPVGSCARVVAVVRPLQLDAVMDALLAEGCTDILVEQVRGYGRQKAHLSFYEEHGFEGSFLPKVRLEFTVDGARLPGAVEALCRGGRTGRIGDGKIFAHLVEPASTGADAAVGDDAAASMPRPVPAPGEPRP